MPEPPPWLGVAVGLSAGCVHVLKMPQEKSARGDALSLAAPPPGSSHAAAETTELARGRRKGAQLLRALQEGGRLGLAWDVSLLADEPRT